MTRGGGGEPPRRGWRPRRARSPRRGRGRGCPARPRGGDRPARRATGVAVHPDVGAEDEDLVPALPRDRLGRVAERVVGGPVAVPHDPHGDEEEGREDEGAHDQGHRQDVSSSGALSTRAETTSPPGGVKSLPAPAAIGSAASLARPPPGDNVRQALRSPRERGLPRKLAATRGPRPSAAAASRCPQPSAQRGGRPPARALAGRPRRVARSRRVSVSAPWPAAVYWLAVSAARRRLRASPRAGSAVAGLPPRARARLAIRSARRRRPRRSPSSGCGARSRSRPRFTTRPRTCCRPRSSPPAACRRRRRRCRSSSSSTTSWSVHGSRRNTCRVMRSRSCPESGSDFPA